MIKKIISLKQKKEREKQKLFIAEGIKFVSEIPKDWQVDLFVVSQTFANENNISAYQKKANTFVVTDTIFHSITDTQAPQGILALCFQKEYNIDSFLEKNKQNGFYILAEKLNDPGNLGTIIRTADAGGVQAIFLSKESVDIYNEKVLRATMGSIFHIPIFQNIDLKQTIEKLHKYHTTVLAAHLKAKEYPYMLNLKQPCAFLIGNEANGLSENAANLCDTYVKLPMIGQAESLNASIAAGILIYETVRQRFIL